MFRVQLNAVILTCLLAVLPPAANADKIDAPDLLERLGGNDAPLVLDVRSEREYQSGHVPGAVHIPYTQLPDRLSELPHEDQEIVVYCEVGGRAGIATEVLEQAGFTQVRNLAGHMKQWRAGGYPQE